MRNRIFLSRSFDALTNPTISSDDSVRSLFVKSFLPYLLYYSRHYIKVAVATKVSTKVAFVLIVAVVLSISNIVTYAIVRQHHKASSSTLPAPPIITDRFNKDPFPSSNLLPYANWTPSASVKHNFHTPTDIINPQSDGNFLFNTIEVRRALIEKFGTAYGCDADPVIAAARGQDVKPIQWPIATDEIPSNTEAEGGPPRISFLFLLNGKFNHARLWTHWFHEARQWSQKHFNEGSGPYDGASVNRSGYSPDEIPLYSIYTHTTDADRPIVLPDQFDEHNHHAVPTVDSKWGNLMWVQHQLLHSAAKDRRNGVFIFVSDSTVPVKPFSFIYEELQANSRSRFLFSNVNLPLVRKHHQWVVLNRSHTVKLLQNPEKWVCSKWLTQRYKRKWSIIHTANDPSAPEKPKQKVAESASCWSAPDEYLIFHALSEIIGVTSIQTQINNGEVYPWPGQDFHTPDRLYGDTRFGHTFVCWPDKRTRCGLIGTFRTAKRASPSTYYSVRSDPFERLVLTHKSSWFARKIDSDCRVADPIGESVHEPDDKFLGTGSVVDHPHSLPLLQDWLIDKLSEWDLWKGNLWDGQNPLIDGSISVDELQSRIALTR